jgi:hypothetical protein
MINIVELLARLPAESFELNLVQVELRNGEHIIKGTGRLAQTEPGELSFTVINDQAPEYDQEVHHHLLSLTTSFDQTKIVGKTDYYQLAAIDEFGNTVTCAYVDLDENYNKRVYHARLRFNLWIKSAELSPTPHFDNAKIFFRNQYDFARFHDVWKMETMELQITLQKKIPYLELEISSSNVDTVIDDVVVKQVTEALDFVMGLEHQFDYRIFTGKKYVDWQVEICYTAQVPINKTTFTAPYRRTGSQGDEEEVNSLLFRHYYQFLKQNPISILPKWHKRIVDSGTGYYYKHGMILSVGIEKLLRVYFPSTQANAEAVNEAEVTKLFEFTASLSDNGLRKKVEVLISGLPHQNYVPKRMLNKLERKQIISENSQKSWSLLRNKYAHGSDYNDDMHVAIDLVRKNVTLYYELILHIISYQGKYTCYFQPPGQESTAYPPINNIF